MLSAFGRRARRTANIHFLLDGNTLTGSMALSSTGSSNTWATTTAPACTLPAGKHVLRLYLDIYRVQHQLDPDRHRQPGAGGQCGAGSVGHPAQCRRACRARISDDGLPNPPAAPRHLEQDFRSRDNDVHQSQPPATTATFSTAGTYVLRLTASDSVFSSTDDCQVIADARPIRPCDHHAGRSSAGHAGGGRGRAQWP